MTLYKSKQLETSKLTNIAMNIKFVPYRFSGTGYTVDLNKVLKVINNYKK